MKWFWLIVSAHYIGAIATAGELIQRGETWVTVLCWSSTGWVYWVVKHGG